MLAFFFSSGSRHAGNHSSALRGRIRRTTPPGRVATPRSLPPVASFEWPAENTLEALGRAIAASKGLEIVIKPIPNDMRHVQISGLTTMIGRTAHVFYDPALSPLNQEQTILHEYAHILHGDVRANDACTHLRSMFDDPIEKRAETTGMQLLAIMHQRRISTQNHEVASEVISFFSGAETNAHRA